MKVIDSKKFWRTVKILVLVVVPWFNTGCAGLAALGPILSSLGGLMGGIAKLGAPAAATPNAAASAGVATANGVAPKKFETPVKKGPSVLTFSSADKLNLTGAT